MSPIIKSSHDVTIGVSLITRVLSLKVLLAIFSVLSWRGLLGASIAASGSNHWGRLPGLQLE